MGLRAGSREGGVYLEDGGVPVADLLPLPDVPLASTTVSGLGLET